MYQEADQWKDFIIEPLTENNIGNISVSINVDNNPYEGCLLELINKTTSQKLTVSITSNYESKFNGIKINYKYYLYILYL